MTSARTTRSPRLTALALGLGLCALAPVSAQAAPAIPSHGQAPAQLETKVDTLVKALMNQRNLPGVSVAISRGGKMIFAKGYGWRNFATKAKMFDDTNIRIGSVTKATVTGPAAFGLMKSKAIDPKTKKLYGAGSVFGSTFDTDLDRGVRRQSPILEVAISPDDQVYTWYRNGKVSKGASFDLDKHTAPAPFSLPSGKNLIDLRALSMTKDGKVYSWWDRCVDGDCGLHVAIGTPTDLDAHSGMSAKAVSLASGVSIHDIVGIGIAKSNDHVYVWYEDGTFSSGTASDFDHYHARKPFSTGMGTGGTSYDIRGVDIAKNDHVYTWFGNGKVTEGMTHDLDKYGKADYTAPAGQSPDILAWYRSITLQHLLDHKAGFERSGDVPGAMTMFGKTEAQLTYSQVHQYFLRTNRLLFQPGTASSYSNHGFGLWTLLIEKISGKPFYNYVRDSYLKPKGLDKWVLPELGNPGEDCRYAANHSFDSNDVPKPFAFEQWGLGLAAGGFRSSAKHLAILMLGLEGKYTAAELDAMGWGKGAKGKLSHNGSTGGGTAFAAMFPDGYISNGGKDLSRVNVVIITNVNAQSKDKNGNPLPSITSQLSDLADDIALAVPDSNVPASFELGKTVGPSPCTVIK